MQIKFGFAKQTRFVNIGRKLEEKGEEVNCRYPCSQSHEFSEDNVKLTSEEGNAAKLREKCNRARVQKVFELAKQK